MEIRVSSVELPLIKELKNRGDNNGGKIIIATHNDSFHADELLAIAVLMEAMPEYHFSVVRTRDVNKIAAADIAIDVGGGRFDHHDTVARYPNGVPMAACGKVLAAVETNSQIQNMLCKELFYAVEAADNGDISSLPRGVSVNKLEWVSAFNPSWDERHYTEGEYYECFYKTLDMVRSVYKRVRQCVVSRIKAKSWILRCKCHLNGQFVELPPGGMPWQNYAINNKRILGAIYQNVSGTQWVVRVAKSDPGINVNRVEFPTEWGSKENECLEDVSKIKGAVFCHKALHIATFKTFEGALHACRTLAGKYQIETKGGVL